VSARHLVASLLVAVGAAGVTACLISAATGMRDVMVLDGGTCASGGPYVVAHECTSADMRLLMIGILGTLVSAGFGLAGTSMLGGRAVVAGLLIWAALFGTLGWNFVDLGLNPPEGMSDTGWQYTGALFWLMAAGGLIPALAFGVGWLRRGGRPEPSFAAPQAVVRATRYPGMGGGGFGWAPPDLGDAPARLNLPPQEDTR
jgi:hypothetical protein